MDKWKCRASSTRGAKDNAHHVERAWVKHQSEAKLTLSNQDWPEFDRGKSSAEDDVDRWKNNGKSSVSQREQNVPLLGVCGHEKKERLMAPVQLMIAEHTERRAQKSLS